MVETPTPAPLHIQALQRAARSGIFSAVVVVLLAVTTASSAETTSADAGEQAARLEQLRKRIGGIKQELGNLRGEHDAMQEALARTEQDIGSVMAELRRLESRAGEAQENIRKLQEERSSRQQDLDKQRVALARELQVAYMTGKQERVKLLLNQEDPAAVSRMLAYHGYFSRARATRMQDFRAILERLGLLEEQLIAERAEAEQLHLQQQEKSARLAVDQEKRRGILAGLQQQLRDKQTELSTLEQDEQRLQQLVSSLQRALAEIPDDGGGIQALQQLKGKLRWPVAGRITRGYGARQASGNLPSRGVHIATPSGADVHAIASGRIVFADWLRGFGLLLIIDHGAGYMSLYGQNSSLYKTVGDRVGRGEVVAAAGSSGGQAQAGLYLELRKNGRPFDPAGWFSGKPASQQADRR